MADKIEVNAGDILTPIVIRDKNRKTIGAAYINLTDIRIPARVQEIIDYMKTIDVDNAGYDALLSFDTMLQDKVNRLFGYDCSSTLFGVVSPTSRVGGTYMVVLLIQAVMEAISEETKKKASERMDRISQYTKRYEV